MTQNIGKVGLLNNGNTCYLNSSLQLLTQAGSYCHKMLRDYKDSKFKKFNDLEKHIVMLMKNKWTINENIYFNPRYTQKVIAKQNSLFDPRAGRQNDAHEALIYIIGLLDHESKLVFKSILTSNVNCKVCNNNSTIDEEFDILSLPITKTVSKSLMSLFETEETDETVFCKICDKRTKCDKKYSIKMLGDNLIIHIKRFQTEVVKGKFRKKKINDRITIEDEIHINDLTYELRGIILHNGSIDGGHYTFLGRDLVNKWVLYNDSTCRDFDLNSNHEISGYIFLYEKC